MSKPANHPYLVAYKYRDSLIFSIFFYLEMERQATIDWPYYEM